MQKAKGGIFDNLTYFVGIFLVSYTFAYTIVFYMCILHING